MCVSIVRVSNQTRGLRLYILMLFRESPGLDAELSTPFPPDTGSSCLALQIGFLRLVALFTTVVGSFIDFLGS